ncbi:MAG: hypothetical protein ACD_79C00298G0002 [uncultured bacterium]|nr:MAG: hypothetical protein ACD_79C00298G0002 [uncultured bacterium]
MSISTSTLRSNIFKLLDEVLKTGKPLEIERKGKILQIQPKETFNKFKNIKKKNIFKVDPDELIHIDWSKEWKP